MEFSRDSRPESAGFSSFAIFNPFRRSLADDSSRDIETVRREAL